MSEEATPLGKAEAVARGLARKLRALEAERAAEAIDSEALFNQLERSHAALRAERDALAKKHSALAAEHAKADAIKDSLSETIDQLRRDKRAQDDALKRLTAAERSWVRVRGLRTGLATPAAAAPLAPPLPPRPPPPPFPTHTSHPF